MYAQVTILLAFSGYLYYVIPSEYGVRRPWYYAIYRVYRQVFGIRKKRKLSMTMRSMDIESHLLTLRQQIEDDSVEEERKHVFQTSCLDPQVPLIIKNIRKVYSDVDLGDKVAINNVSFQVRKGTVFGLLGKSLIIYQMYLKYRNKWSWKEFTYFHFNWIKRSYIRKCKISWI